MARSLWSNHACIAIARIILPTTASHLCWYTNQFNTPVLLNIKADNNIV